MCDICSRVRGLRRLPATQRGPHAHTRSASGKALPAADPARRPGSPARRECCPPCWPGLALWPVRALAPRKRRRPAAIVRPGCLLPELPQRWPCSCCRRRSGHAGPLACCRSCCPGSLARRPAGPLACLLPELPQRWPCSCCRRRSGHAGRRSAGHGRRHGPPWPSCRCPCNDHATQHATHHAAAASRRRAARPRKQHRRCCPYRDAMHHHATRTPQVATPTVLPLSLRSSCARAFHEATPPGSRKKFPGTQYQKGTVFREKISCGVGEPKIWLVF